MKHVLLAAGVAAALAQHAFATRGVIDDPDGSTNVRAARSRESAIVAVAKNGEVIDYESDSDTQWWEVTLSSGKKGYMHSSRIRRHATMAELADTTPGDEVNEWSRTHGLPDYYPTARAAARGDAAAMQRFFKRFGDGAAAETHDEVFGIVMHLLGDQKFAKFLTTQSAGYRAEVREMLVEGNMLYPFEAEAYLKRHFPKTAALLFR